MTAISVPAVSRLEPKVAKRLFGLVFAIVAVILYLIFTGQWTIPFDSDYPLFTTLNEARDWIDANRSLVRRP